jgi:F420-dependent oxidoreductase-like protein
VRVALMIEGQEGVTWEQWCALAAACEEHGVETLFRSDHYISPADEGGNVAHDAWTTLAALAARTTVLRLGTLVSPATFRPPALLANAAATVDHISGGRIELGLGAGWFEAEHVAYGIPFHSTGERFDRFAEQVEIVRGLLTTPEGETYSFGGKHYTLSDSPALPKPVQSPLPLILGGAGKKRGAELAARYADEFNVAFRPPAAVGEIFDNVRAAAAQTGRKLVYSTAQVLCVGRDEAELRRRADAIGTPLDDLRRTELAGTPAEVLDRIGHLGELGASRLYLQARDLGDLDHLELVASEILPHV